MASDMRKSRDLNSDTVDSKVRLLMTRPEPVRTVGVILEIGQNLTCTPHSGNATATA
jgi:hypothetical protein